MTQTEKANTQQNLGPRASFFLAFPPLVFRVAPYRGPSVRKKGRPGIEVAHDVS